MLYRTVTHLAMPAPGLGSFHLQFSLPEMHFPEVPVVLPLQVFAIFSYVSFPMTPFMNTQPRIALLTPFGIPYALPHFFLLNITIIFF